MMSMYIGNACRMLLAAVVSVLAAFAATPAPTMATPTLSTIQAYTYDSHSDSASLINTVTEHGPPPAYDRSTYDAVDRWSPGAPVRLNGATPPAAFAYDHPGRHVQTARGSHGAEEGFGSTEQGSYVARRSGVATKSADNLPTVNWGQQAKHFPGHPNYIPGRSSMTANPEALIQRAGTGTPVNKVPRGEAGFKERIDFGDDIGRYVTQEGVSSPTSIGILHYRADGSVHIVPGRPQ